MADEKNLEEKDKQGNEGASGAEGTGVTNESNTAANSPIELSDEAFMAEVERRTGRKVSSIEELKLPKPEPTQEEKAKELTDRQKKLLGLHMEKGGTIESFAEIQAFSNKDLKEISVKKAIAEYVAMGFSEDDAKVELKKRYYQFADDELGELEDDEKNSLLLKREKFTEKLHKKAFHEQENAKKYLQNLERYITEQEVEAEMDAKLQAEAENLTTTLDRKLVIGLGDFNGLKLAPVEYTVSDEDLSSVIDVVKNKSSREALFLREDGSDNIDRLAKLLLLEKSLDKIVAKVAAIAANEQVEAFEKIATKNPKDLEFNQGTGGGSNGSFKVKQVGRVTFDN